MKKIILLYLLFAFISSFLLIGCTTQRSYDSGGSQQQANKVNLCDEISTPSASVNCKNVPTDDHPELFPGTYGYECKVTVSGDSRVKYMVTSSVGPTREASAGETLTIREYPGDYFTVRPNMKEAPWTSCDNKRIFIYKDDFTGDPVE